MSDLVTVIIPVYKNIIFLKDSLKSVVKQSYKFIEIIIVNDGNSDLKDIKKTIKKYKKKIKLINIKKNSGVAYALNLGIKQSKGKYISWLSHDDYFHKNKIKDQVNILKTQKKKICFTNFYVVDEQKNILRMINVNSRFFNLKENVFFRDNLNLSTALIHKKIFYKIGKFNIKKKHTQDYEFIFRAFKKFEPILINNYYFFSRSHKTQSSKLDYRNAQIEKEILISSIQNQVIDIYFKSNIFKKAYIVFFLGKRNLRNSIKIVKKIISKENFFLNILMYIIFYVSRSKI